jgi:hypothetical protein
MLQLVPLFPRSKKKTNEVELTSGMKIMRRFLNLIGQRPLRADSVL